MSTVKPLYGSNNQAYTVTLNSLANNAYASGQVFDNTSSLFDDVKFQFKWKNAGTVSGVPTVAVYMAETANGGTNYSDGVTASGTPTPTVPPNMKLLYVLQAPTASTAYVSDCFYVRSAAQISTLPDKFILVFLNSTGGTSDSTAGNFSVFSEGLNPQIV
jgi:hypothetical protein